MTSSHPPQCLMGCGFYGNPQFDGYCSQCFKTTDKGKADSTPKKVMSPSPVSEPKLMSTSASASSLDTNINGSITSPCATNITTSPTSGPSLSGLPVDSVSSLGTSDLSAEPLVKESSSDGVSPAPPSCPGTDSAKKTRKPGRCWTCNCKMGIMAYDCRCGGHFCGKHRYVEEHDCTFDYKEDGASQIRKNNPKVVGEKIQKI